jgi:hypothetical protein
MTSVPLRLPYQLLHKTPSVKEALDRAMEERLRKKDILFENQGH